MPQGALLLRFVQRCRHRLMWSAFVRYSCLALGIPVTAAAALSVALGSPVVGWATAAVAAGLAAAGLAAHLRAPSLPAAAGAVDERLGLPDVVAAGLEMRRRDDVVAALVVRDAAARVGDLSPRQLFPIRVGMSHRIGAAAAIAAFAVLALDPFRPTSDPVHTKAGAGVGGATTQAAGAGATGESRDAARPGESSVTPAAAADASRARTRDGEQSEAVARASTATPPQQTAPAADQSGASGSGSAGQDAARNAADAASTKGDGAQGDRSRAASSASASTVAPDGRAAGSGAAADGSAEGSPRSGGISGGTLTGAATRSQQAPPAPGTPGYAARYRAARAGAEAALARDEVAPEYRANVRRYFAAIEPREQE